VSVQRPKGRSSWQFLASTEHKISEFKENKEIKPKNFRGTMKILILQSSTFLQFFDIFMKFRNSKMFSMITKRK